MFSIDSYFLCYHNGAVDTKFKTSNVSFSIDCESACFTFKETCFCRSSFSWTFDRHPYPVWVDKACGDVICKNGGVAIKSIATIESCSTTTQFDIFDISPWVDNKIFDNYIQIKPSESVQVLQELTVNVAYSGFGANRFKFVFQDGYINETKKPTCTHAYLKPGSFNLTIEVVSNQFPSFRVTRTIFVMLFKVLFNPTTPSMLDTSQLSNISGFVLGGTTLLPTFELGITHPMTHFGKYIYFVFFIFLSILNLGLHLRYFRVYHL